MTNPSRPSEYALYAARLVAISASRSGYLPSYGPTSPDHSADFDGAVAAGLITPFRRSASGRRLGYKATEAGKALLVEYKAADKAASAARIAAAEAATGIANLDRPLSELSEEESEKVAAYFKAKREAKRAAASGVARARLDADGTAAPLTRLVAHVRTGDCIGSFVSADAVEDIATGDRTAVR